MSTIMYTYDLRTYETTGSRTAQIVGGKELTISAAATPVPTGPDKTGHTQVYKPKGTARWVYDPQSLDVASQGEHGTWYYIADHRQHMDSKGTKIGGTPYWQPAEGDDWQSPPRYTEELGPLPDGAVTERPAKPLSVLKAEKEREITAACDAAIVASLTMPTSAPSSAEVAVAAASLAGIDPDGPDTLLALHTARRDELLATVAAAKSPTDLDSVVVSYAV